MFTPALQLASPSQGPQPGLWRDQPSLHNEQELAAAVWRFQQPPLPERQLRPRHCEPRETGPLRGGRTGLGGDGGVAEQSWGMNPGPGALASEPELLLNSNCVSFLSSLPEAALWNS